MNKKVILFCGVESTGKTTAIKNMLKFLKNKGIKTEAVYEVGRDVCEQSGGVFEMSLLDYEQILYCHQANLIKALSMPDVEVILLDTDSTYTRYYLDKDINRLGNNSQSQYLINLSEQIAKTNQELKRITKIIYLSSTCRFVQDGTRTYESTRKEDDKFLFNLYKKVYTNTPIVNITQSNFNIRTKQIEKEIAEIVIK